MGSYTKLLAAQLTDLYERRPEAWSLEPWEMQMLLWSLGYTDDLVDEGLLAQAMMQTFRIERFGFRVYNGGRS
jgi:hypothetical protein